MQIRAAGEAVDGKRKSFTGSSAGIGFAVKEESGCCSWLGVGGLGFRVFMFGTSVFAGVKKS